jgi:hypothetical protein
VNDAIRELSNAAHFSTADKEEKQSIPQWLICEKRFEPVVVRRTPFGADKGHSST